MKKQPSEELDCLTRAFEESDLSKIVELRKNKFSEDYPKGSSKTGIGNPHFALLLNGVAQRNYGLLRLAYHIKPEAMGKTGCHGMFQHKKRHKSAKVIRDGDKTVAADGYLNTFFEVDPDDFEADLRKNFNALAKKLKSLGANRTNLCKNCKKEKKGCVVKPSSPVSSCSLYEPK